MLLFHCLLSRPVTCAKLFACNIPNDRGRDFSSYISDWLCFPILLRQEKELLFRQKVLALESLVLKLIQNSDVVSVTGKNIQVF